MCAVHFVGIKHLYRALMLPSSLLTDEQLINYLENSRATTGCYNRYKGRLLLLAASQGRRNLCRWLVKSFTCNVNVRSQAFRTPLHESIREKFINVAVCLIQLGATKVIFDEDYYSPVDYTLDSVDLSFFMPFMSWSSIIRFMEVNAKNSFAIEKELHREMLKKSIQIEEALNDAVSNSYYMEVYLRRTSDESVFKLEDKKKLTPQKYLKFFERKNEVIFKVLVHEYHTLFLCLSGNVYSCGLGLGGRLGLSSDEAVLLPEKVILSCSTRFNFGSVMADGKECLVCISAAVGVHHSVFLCNNNVILTCGLNTYCQLGIEPPPETVYKPKRAKIENHSCSILDVAASTYHSVAWTHTSVYSCGLHAGQLGHAYSNKKTIKYFKTVANKEYKFKSIMRVAVSDGATVVIDGGFTMFILHKYKWQEVEVSRLALPSLLVAKISVHGGQLDEKRLQSFTTCYRPEPLKVALLMKEYDRYWIYLWQEGDTRLLECYFDGPDTFSVPQYDVLLTSTEMLLLSSRGKVFRAPIPEPVAGSVNYCIKNLRCMFGIYRAIGIASDPNGTNMAVLQVRSNCKSKLSEIVLSPSTFRSDFENLYHETQLGYTYSDITYKVGNMSFLAHKCILAECFNDLRLRNQVDGVVHISSVYPNIFEQMLIFAYLGRSCVPKFPKEGLTSGSVNEMSSNEHRKHENSIDLAKKAAIQFKVNEYLDTLEALSVSIVKQSNFEVLKREVPFHREKFKYLSDIKLKSEDGLVFSAHKCILIARSPFFKTAFSETWFQSSNQPFEYRVDFPGSVLYEILEFIYTDNISKSTKEMNLRFWFCLLTGADQLLLTRLKEMAARAILSRMNVRNVCEILKLADLSLNPLKIRCFEFICENLASLLYSKYFKKLDDCLLDELTEFYRNEFKKETDWFQLENKGKRKSETLTAADIILAQEIASAKELAVEVKESSRRGRKPGKKSSEKLDVRAKLERSRQSARECRARKKLRYQYLEELVTDREKAVFALRQELEKLRIWCHELDEGRIPEGFQAFLEDVGVIKEEQ